MSKNVPLINIVSLLLILVLQSCKPAVNEKAATLSNLEVEQIKSMKDLSSYTFLDVRTPDEISEGKIENALEKDYRSDNLKFMKKNGFSNVINMKGGYTAWKKN